MRLVGYLWIADADDELCRLFCFSPGLPGEGSIARIECPVIAGHAWGATQLTLLARGEPILLLGCNGQVGTELRRVLKDYPALVAPQRSELDLADAANIRRMVRAVKPRWILNAAAYTAVDKAESEPELAYAINAEAVHALGREAHDLGAAVVHFSTDYVFDGEAATPRREDDPTNPLGVYGASKLAGEQALVASGAACFIFRTSWVYSTHGKNFTLTMLKLAAERAEIRIVADQVGAPTFARDLAHLVHHAIKQSEIIVTQEELPLRDAVSRLGGLYHASNAGETSWFGFAEELLQLAYSKRLLGRLPKLVPIATAEYTTPARRPADSRLACDLLRERLGFEMPTWRQSIEAAMEELRESQQSPGVFQDRV